MFDGFADKALSEERLALRFWPTHSALLARLENTTPELIASIPALIEDAVSPLLGEAGRVTESCLDTQVISLIQTVVSRVLTKGFRSVNIYSAV